MPAVTVTQFGPPLRWGNAAGKAIIAEVWQIPESSAADTATLASINVSNFIGVVGTVEHTVVTNTEAGVSVAVATLVDIATDNFTEILLVGYARDNAPS